MRVKSSEFTQSCNDKNRFGTLAIATFIYSQAWRSDNRLFASGIDNRLRQEGGSNNDDDYGMMAWYDVLIILDETGMIRCASVVARDYGRSVLRGERQRYPQIRRQAANTSNAITTTTSPPKSNRFFGSSLISSKS